MKEAEKKKAPEQTAKSGHAHIAVPPGAPEGKYLFGMVKVGARGQVVIPKRAREIFEIQPGDSLLMLGDESTGIAILRKDFAASILEQIMGKTKGEV